MTREPNGSYEGRKTMELENIYMLTVGQLRELLAHACAEETVDSWWEEITEDDLESVGFYDELDDDDYTAYDEDDELDDDYEDEDEDECWDDEEEDDPDLDEDEVCVGDVLPDPAREQTAHNIAADIRAGLYSYNLVKTLYDDDILERIYQLI